MEKERLLEKISKGKPEAKAHPGVFLTQEAPDSEQLLEEFKKQAKLVGAEIIELNNKQDTDQIISGQFPDAIDFRKEANRREYDDDCENQKLEKLKSVILEGRFAVAENGAVWVDDSCYPNRLISFVTENLILLVPKKNLVATMHEAYEMISKIDYSFGVFISGPSKTADIEQSLVYGAHGAKRLNILMI